MGERRGNVQVIVHAARQLAPSDFKFLKKPTSDPYCVVTLGSQSFRTATVREDLNPSWEHAGSLLIGTFLPGAVLRLLGHGRPKGDALTASEEEVLELEVFDEDLMSCDDPLGSCTTSLKEVFERPEEWVQMELQLRPAPGFASGGSLLVSLCWEPAPFLPPYVLRMVAVVAFAASFAMLFLAAFCRWQAPDVEAGSLLQPGVAAALLLAAAVQLLAAVVHFVTAHALGYAHVDDLAAATNASQSLSGALASYGAAGSQAAAETAPTLVISARARGVTRYEIGVAVAQDLLGGVHLPVVIIGWLLPIGGLALTGLAVALQVLQHVPKRVFPGYVLALIGSVVGVWGIIIAMAAETGPRVQHGERRSKMRRHAALARSRTKTFSEASGSVGERVGRREFVRRRFFGGGPTSPEK